MITIRINGQEHTVNVSGDTPLLWVLRDHVGLTGTKYGCGMSLCGACTVHVDGQAMRSCMLPVETLADKSVTTIEGLAQAEELSSVQQAWLDCDVAQCGYCQSGQIMQAEALLAANPSPTDADIDAAMAGNICRCGTYQRVREAIQLAAHKQSERTL